MMKKTPFICGGPVPLNAEVYVSREIDSEAVNAIQNKDYLSVFGPRQVGKTSLLHRIQALVESRYDYAAAILDLSSINDPEMTFKEWAYQLYQLIDDQIQPFLGKGKAIPVPRDIISFRNYWAKLAQSVNKPSVLILFDEANSVPARINDPFFSTLRSIYSYKRTNRPDPNLSKINFVFAGVFEPEKLVINRQNSPFNVSKKIRLGDFTKRELSAMTAVLQKKLDVKVSENWIFQWTNGHPYLSQVLLDLLYKHILDENLPKITENTVSQLIPLLLDEASDNIDHTIKLVLNDPDKCKRMTQILSDPTIPFSRASRLTAQLELDGIIRDDGTGKIMIRNRLYADSLKKALEIPVSSMISSAAADVTTRTDIFISYSHADDSKYIRKLRVHLDPLQQKNKIFLWDDSRIKPGQKWREEIESAIQRAKIAILMVSPDFLASQFIKDHELPKILRAAEGTGLRIVWIPVSSSAYQDTNIEPYHAVVNPSTPLDTMNDGELNGTLLRVYQEVKRIIQS